MQVTTASDMPAFIRARDPSVSLRPHPAAGDLYVCFSADVQDEEGGGGGGAHKRVTLRLTPCDSVGKVGGEELTILVDASWV